MINLILFTLSLASAAPNLVLSQLEWTPASPVGGDWVWVSVRVTNKGDMPTTNTFNQVEFFIKNSTFLAASHGPIGVCESHTFRTPVQVRAETGSWQMGARMVPWMGEPMPPSNVLSGTMVMQ